MNESKIVNFVIKKKLRKKCYVFCGGYRILYKFAFFILYSFHPKLIVAHLKYKFINIF